MLRTVYILESGTQPDKFVIAMDNQFCSKISTNHMRQDRVAFHGAGLLVKQYSGDVSRSIQ